MDFFSALLNVLAIIAIIAVGAFLVIFISDLAISIIDGKNSMFFSRGKNKENITEKIEDKKAEQKSIDKSEEEDILLTYKEEPVKEEYKIDYNQAAKEEEMFLRKRNDVDYFKPISKQQEEVKEQAVENEYDVENDEEEYNEYIKQINEKAIAIIDRENRPTIKTDVIKKEFNYFNFLDDGSETETDKDNNITEEKVEETIEEPVKQVEEVVEPIDPTTTQEYKLLVQKMEEMEKAIEEEKAKTKIAKEELEQLRIKEQSVATADAMPAETMEELEARLILLEDRLKLNEKDLKTNKKEFIPLRRIKKNLEKDELKLRRKEAIVAKQKIMLFGVNNYVYDEEKEKKLAEDLDLLDGLRLSVQHCEDVMASNKDRYPALEKTYTILTRTNDQLKSDIEDIQKKIDFLKNKKD